MAFDKSESVYLIFGNRPFNRLRCTVIERLPYLVIISISFMISFDNSLYLQLNSFVFDLNSWLCSFTNKLIVIFATFSGNVKFRCHGHSRFLVLVFLWFPVTSFLFGLNLPPNSHINVLFVTN